MKNYKSIFDGGNDSTAPNQRFYLKQEVTRGQMIAPEGTDFFFSLNGGTISFNQEFASSEHRSDRHNTTTIANKKTTEWNFNTYLNIDVEVAAGITSADPAMHALWKSALGRQVIDGTGVHYDSAQDPSTTFTLFEVGDHWCKQAPACWVDQAVINAVGDGQTTVEWTGRGATTYYVGIGKSEAATAGNNVTLKTPNQARRFPVGAMVMLLDYADGLTRIEGTGAAPRIVTASNATTGVIALSGAALTVDGTTNPFLVCYWEPTGADAINNPQTGLVGNVTIDTLSVSCVRSATITLNNQHEAVDYCYGTDMLAAPYFVPADRLQVTVGIELNMNAPLLEFINRCQNGESHAIELKVGSSTTRHFGVDLPKVIFSVPEVAVPDAGSIPVSFEGVAYQTGVDVADEVTASYL
jgi:hypothetical protein